MLPLKERTRWAINYVIERDGLSNLKVGKKVGFNKETVSSYRRMITEPKIQFMVNFCDGFGFNMLWFAKGIGEPFPGARQQFPEICGPDESRDLQEALEDLEGLPVAHQVGSARRKNEGDEIGVISLGKDKSLSIDVFLHYIEELGKLKERIRLIEAELKCHKPPNGIERRSTWQKFDKIFSDLH